MTVKDHYENHLAGLYSWISGDFSSRISSNADFFKMHNVTPKFNKVAIDLGAGCGFQSIPLAKNGFQVLAIDLSKQLLHELQQYSKDLKIDTKEGDLLDFQEYLKIDPELIVCMGDTITHLSDIGSVYGLCDKIYSSLLKGGTAVFTFRDLNFELSEGQRFIPVRSSDDIIFTCFLEYFSDYVKVFDIVHEREKEGWKQKVSWYRKLKISKEEMETMLIKCGFDIIYSEMKSGFVEIIVRK